MSTQAILTSETLAAETHEEPAKKESVLEKIEGDVKKFVSILDFVGKESDKGLTFAVKYSVPLEGLVDLFFPGIGPAAAGGVAALNLIQSTVLEVKQKSGALPKGLTPEQMLADEMQLVAPAVLQLLAQAGFLTDTAHVTKVVQAVVAILNMRPAPSA